MFGISSIFVFFPVLLNFLFIDALSNIHNRNVHIRMISEGSCDTEDWRNDAENVALASQE